MNERFPTVGLIGAGHHARMMLTPAAALGVNLILFASAANDSGAQVGRYVIGDQRNLDEVLRFAKGCDLLTIEDSSVPLSVIKGLESEGVRIYPTSSSLTYLQDNAALRAKLSPLDSIKFSDEATQGFDFEIAVLVARSPHSQATSWAPAEILREDGDWVATETPSRKLSTSLAERVQRLALEVAHSLGVIGVMAVEMAIKDEDIFICEIVMHPHFAGLWSIDGAVTSQYEQHLRAILDLPLGSPAMTDKVVVTGNVLSGSKSDMYRPYLHLMARNSSLRFHQYRNEALQGSSTGHITACGNDPTFLLTEIDHARDYMSGVVED